MTRFRKVKLYQLDGLWTYGLTVKHIEDAREQARLRPWTEQPVGLLKSGARVVVKWKGGYRYEYTAQSYADNGSDLHCIDAYSVSIDRLIAAFTKLKVR